MNLPELLYLWHPGTKDIFSGYGLVIAPNHLVGVVMVDRPNTALPNPGKKAGSQNQRVF